MIIKKVDKMKQKTYSGKGVMSCMNVCKKYNLNKLNSNLYISNPKDIDSKWTITVKQ